MNTYIGWCGQAGIVEYNWQGIVAESVVGQREFFDQNAVSSLFINADGSRVVKVRTTIVTVPINSKCNLVGIVPQTAIGYFTAHDMRSLQGWFCAKDQEN